MSAYPSLVERLNTTVARELAAAVSGLLLVGFIVMHLAGNLLIFLGPEAMNDYSAKLHAVPELLWAARFGLIAALIVHMGCTIALARANRDKRDRPYYVEVQQGRKTVATRLMLLSGLTLFFFLFLHLYDFTLRSHEGPNALVGDEHLGLYGLVWNSFGNPVRSLVYLIAVSCVGMHLSHALSSLLVTLGVLSDRATPKVEMAARAAGLAVALGFASIPLYVMAATYLF